MCYINTNIYGSTTLHGNIIFMKCICCSNAISLLWNIRCRYARRKAIQITSFISINSIQSVEKLNCTERGGHIFLYVILDVYKILKCCLLLENIDNLFLKRPNSLFLRKKNHKINT